MILPLANEIVISCNYKDGTKTVNFSEMESALTLRASVSGSDLDCPGAPEGEIRTGFPLFRCCQLGKEVRAEFFACASAAGHFYPGQNAMARKSRIPSAFFGRRGDQNARRALPSCAPRGSGSVPHRPVLTVSKPPPGFPEAVCRCRSRGGKRAAFRAPATGRPSFPARLAVAKYTRV